MLLVLSFKPLLMFVSVFLLVVVAVAAVVVRRLLLVMFGIVVDAAVVVAVGAALSANSCLMHATVWSLLSSL